jgi:sigma-B regulation protein RsbU (phosphoserine phosphatase)
MSADVSRTPAPDEAGYHRREPSFRTKLVAGVCGLVLLTGAVVLWLAHRSARSTTEALTSSVFREVSGRAAAYTRGFVMRAAPVAGSVSQLADKGLAIDDPERLAPQVISLLKANPRLSWVSYSDEAGAFTGAYRMPDGKLRLYRSTIANGRTHRVEHDVLPDGSLKLFQTDDDSGYDPRGRPFYTQAKQLGRLTWLKPYLFQLFWAPGVTCAAPVTDASGKFRGVLTADFDLIALSQFVAGLSISEHSRVFLFSDDQVLLAHPNEQGNAISGNRDGARLLTLGDAGDPLVDAYRVNVRPEMLRSAGDGGEAFHFFEFRHGGADYLGSTTSFPIGDDLVWVVGVAAPKSDFVGDVWRTQRYALAAAAAAVFAAVALAFVLGRAVSRPVLALTSFVRRVGAGDLEAKAEIGGGREFRELSTALNRMIADLRDRLRLRHSLDLAMQVQQQLLPRKSPTVPGLDVAGHSTYCDETGGDYYDFLVLDEAVGGGLLFALGDVMGHGVAAALVMAGVRAVLRDRAVEPGGLADLMNRLNRLLATDLKGERFMTMHLSVIDPRSRVMRWASAGHDAAIVFDPARGQFEEIGEGGMPLGILDEATYAEETYGPLRPGQVIFVGTDGVWEMPDVKGEPFGKERLREVMRGSAAGSAADVAHAIRERLVAFRGDARQVDDVTYVVVKVLPTSS